MTDWYYADAGNTRHGPLTTPALLQLRQQGTVGADTLLWRDGLSGWMPLHELAHELGDAPADAAQGAPVAAPASADAWTLEPTGTPADAGPAAQTDHGWRTVADNAHTAHGGAAAPGASPYAPPVAPVARPDAVIHGGEVVYAGFRKRLAAYLIDGLIVGIGGMVVGGLVGGVIGGLLAVSGVAGDLGLVLIQVVANLLSLVIGAAYYAWFHASRSMATPGKMAVGIKVVRLNGERISIARGIGRYFATILSAMILMIGFLMAAFTARKQALHDMVCDTLVVDKWAFTGHPELQRHELGTVTVVVLVIFGLLFGLGVLGIAAAIGMAAFQ